ncbi:MAG: hypothetical protein HQL07_11775 [Nitrospirae bacterium]|nr:hypothetical protein [Magnetococcales bacterium]
MIAYGFTVVNSANPLSMQIGYASVIKIALLCFLMLAALEFVHMVWLVAIDFRIELREQYSAFEKTNTRIGQENKFDLDGILSSLRQFNLWENSIAVVATRPSSTGEEKTETIITSSLDLILVGSMILPGNNSWAVFVRKKSAEQQVILRLGDEIDGAKLARIERNAAFFKNGDRMEKVERPPFTDRSKDRHSYGKTKEVSMVPNAQETSTPETMAQEGKAVKISKTMLDNILKRIGDKLPDFDLQPFYTHGRLLGYRLGAKEEWPILNVLGIQNGDIFIRLNGIAVTDLQAMEEIKKLVAKLRTLALEFQREGHLQKLDIVIE